MTCIIIDDEPLAVKLLESFVARTPQLQLVSSFTDSVKAIAALRQQPVDLVFLDIQMPDLDGMELAHMLPAETMIIFTTAFKEYAFDSYEVSAVDFLLKPIRYNKFLAAVEKCEKRRVESGEWRVEKGKWRVESLFIRVDGELRQLQTDDILYVQGMKDYVMFYLLSMKAVEDMLPAERFMRVHRSYIVALDKIRSIDRNDCIYIGQEIIHVTEAYREAFQKYITEKSI